MNTRKKWLTASIFALIMAAFMVSCVDENVEQIGTCPEVVSTDPENLENGVNLNQVITITFNGPMDPETISQDAFMLESGTAVNGRIAGMAEVAGSVSYNEENYTMSFTPEVALMAQTNYTATVGTVVKDPLGNALQVNYVWQFSTGTTPLVMTTSPANLATNVALDAVITADFNQNMDPLSINASSFTVSNGTDLIAGQIEYAGTTASFIPDMELEGGITYVATISTEAISTDAIPMESNYTWEFTTEDLVPSIVETSPMDLATNVARDEEITVDFSQNMDPATITSTSFTVSDGTNLITGQISYAGVRATFTPDNNLMSGTTYTATVTTAAKNVDGLALENDYEWTFSTVAPLGPSGIDLQSIAAYGIFAGVGVSNNAGFSEIRNMNVGITPGVRSSITGFPPAIVVNGAIHASDDTEPAGIAATLQQAKDDLVEVYLFVEGATSPAPSSVAGDLGGTTLAPGIYKSTSTLLLQSGDLTLDAQGDENAVWIFQIASDFTTVGGAGGNVILSGGAQAKNVYWQTGSSATIGDGTSFKGNILALTSITMNSGAVAEGRMLARNGSVVMTDTNIIEKP
ncbi:ice-binding family protein [Marivirga sp.]|uniref:ice-binding family protein n=1 Tax=Marivirga sp. TaxID=2018662 RepID=UPI002D7EE9F2|nr:ice-binding family protein [Marivirga sp.]HET8861490.1 ice-binding family protein [Marivirga sp.]